MGALARARTFASLLPPFAYHTLHPFTCPHSLCSLEDKVRAAAKRAQALATAVSAEVSKDLPLLMHGLEKYASAAVDAAAKEMHGDTHIVVDFYAHNLQPWVKRGKEQALYLGRILAALAQQLAALLPSNFNLFCVRCAGKVSPLDASLQGKLNKDEQTAYAAQGILLIELSQGIVKAVWTRSAAILVR